MPLSKLSVAVRLAVVGRDRTSLKSFGRVFVGGYFKVRKGVMAGIVDCVCMIVNRKGFMSKTRVINHLYSSSLKVNKQDFAQALKSTATFLICR